MFISALFCTSFTVNIFFQLATEFIIIIWKDQKILLRYGFQSRYLPLLMRKQGISLTSLGLYKLLLIPWICKFFISAFIVDKYRSKKFWLLFTMFMLSFLSFMGIFFDSFYELAVLIFLLNTASATQDICVDWYAISNLRQEDLGLGKWNSL